MATVTESGSSHPTSRTEEVALSIVLPAYNEARNLSALLPEIVDICNRADYHPYEVVVVDDGSTDHTAAKAQHAAEMYEPVRAIILQDNYGQSAALAAGIDHAGGDIIIPMDADGQNDPADIPVMLSEIKQGADVVSGWRRDRQDPLSKRVPSAIQTRLAKWTGPDIHDFGCTLTAYRADAIDEVDLRGERHRYIPATLDQLGYDVTEVEVNHRERAHGDSHYGTGRLIRGFVDLLFHLFRVRYRDRPMHIFGGTGLIILALGIGLGTWLSLQRLVFGIGLLPRLPALLLSISLALFGAGMLALGIVTELLTELIAQSEQPYRVERVIR